MLVLHKFDWVAFGLLIIFVDEEFEPLQVRGKKTQHVSMSRTPFRYRKGPSQDQGRMYLDVNYNFMATLGVAV